MSTKQFAMQRLYWYGGSVFLARIIGQYTCAHECSEVLPIVLPLPPGHTIPMGQIFSADIGSRGFRSVMASLAGGSVATSAARARLRWIDDSTYLHEWLDAVAEDPSNFCLNFLARSSIASALTVPTESEGEYAMIGSDTLAPFLWVEYGICRRLQRDNISATLKQQLALEYERYENRQLDNFKRPEDDPPIFGHPHVSVNSALWPLRPPQSKPAIDRFGMASFLIKDLVPQADIYLAHAIPTGNRLPSTYAIVPLETKTEAEEAILAETDPDSPTKQLARRRLLSAQRKRKDAPTEDPLGQLTGSQSSGTQPFDSMVTPSTDRGGYFGSSSRHSQSVTAATVRTSNSGIGPHVDPMDDGTLTSARDPDQQLPRPPPNYEAFAAPPTSFQQRLDPLSSRLHMANSAPRNQRHSVTATWHHPTPDAANDSTFPSVNTGTGQHNQNRTLPANVTPFQIEIVDDSNKRSRSELLYMKRDVRTWKVDAQQLWGPAELFHFAQYLAADGPSISGVFLATSSPIPHEWCLYPADISGPFRTKVLHPDATGKSARIYFHSLLQSASLFQIGHFAQPTAVLGSTFFTDQVFKRFRDTSLWLPAPLTADQNLDEMFTALDYNRLAPDSTDARFHPDGETREHMKTVISNLKFVFAVASQQDFTLTARQSLLSKCLDWFLQALDDPVLRMEWTDRSIPLTSLSFEILESLHVTMVRRVFAFTASNAALAEVTPMSSSGTSSAPLVLMNPSSSQHAGSATVIALLNDWRNNELTRLSDSKKRRTDPVLHPMGDQRPYLCSMRRSMDRRSTRTDGR